MLRIKFPPKLPFAFVPLLFLSASLSFPQPSIRIAEGTSIKLGPLYEGRTTVRELTVGNGGRDTLVIDNLRTSCGCAVAQLSSYSVPPGGSEKLTVTFDSKDIQGAIKREVFFSSNDKDHSKMEITFTGNIIPIVEVTPRYISFGTRPLGQVTRRTVKIRNTLADTIRILSCRAPDPQLRLEVLDSILLPHDSVNVNVDLVPATTGKLLGQIEIKTDSPLKPLIKISYIGKIK